jgi:hypothetical protein
MPRRRASGRRQGGATTTRSTRGSSLLRPALSAAASGDFRPVVSRCVLLTPLGGGSPIVFTGVALRARLTCCGCGGQDRRVCLVFSRTASSCRTRRERVEPSACSKADSGGGAWQAGAILCVAAKMALVGYVQRCNGNDAAHRGDGIYKPTRTEAARGTNATRACDARSLVSGVHKGLYAHSPSRGVRRNGGRPGL